jgi:hypothetical protein
VQLVQLVRPTRVQRPLKENGVRARVQGVRTARATCSPSCSNSLARRERRAAQARRGARQGPRNTGGEAAGRSAAASAPGGTRRRPKRPSGPDVFVVFNYYLTFGLVWLFFLALALPTSQFTQQYSNHTDVIRSIVWLRRTRSHLVIDITACTQAKHR